MLSSEHNCQRRQKGQKKREKRARKILGVGPSSRVNEQSGGYANHLTGRRIYYVRLEVYSGLYVFLSSKGGEDSSSVGCRESRGTVLVQFLDIVLGSSFAGAHTLILPPFTQGYLLARDRLSVTTRQCPSIKYLNN